MDEATLRRVLDEALSSVREEVSSVREEVASVREEVASVREDLRATEARLIESAQLQFRQMRELYQGLSERVDAADKEVARQFAQTRAAIEALHATVQNQDFRADQLIRRVTALELRNPTE